MRAVFNIVVTLTVVILGGLVWVLLKPPQWVADVAPAIASLIHGGQPPEAKLPPEKLKGTPQRVKHHAGHFEVQRGDGTLAVPLEMSGPVQVEIHNAFPIDRLVRQGTPKTMVLAIYGQPAFRVTMEDRGHLLERYIYVDTPTNRMTFVSFENSRVTAAQTSTN
jgi:hypothetical protein